MKKVIERCEHIHARAGTAQSSQVVDPKDPCVKEEKNYFEKVWLRCLKSMKERGMEIAVISFLYFYLIFIDLDGHSRIWSTTLHSRFAFQWSPVE